MITKEEYEEIINNKIYWENVSCGCHLNPPCSKCTDSPSDEDLENVKEYEYFLKDGDEMKHLPLETCKRLSHLVKEHEGMWHCIFTNGNKVLDIDACQDEETLGFLKRNIEKYPALDLSEALDLLPDMIKEMVKGFAMLRIEKIETEYLIKYEGRYVQMFYTLDKDLLTAVDKTLNWLLDNTHLKEGNK